MTARHVSNPRRRTRAGCGRHARGRAGGAGPPQRVGVRHEANVALEGVVTRYEWANPHVYIWLAAPDASGEAVEWEIEAQPPAMLRRMGWSQDTLSVGDTIQATGNPARNRAA